MISVQYIVLHVLLVLVTYISCKKSNHSLLTNIGNTQCGLLLLLLLKKAYVGEG